MKRSTFLATLALALTACGADSSAIEILGRAAPSDPKACTFMAGGLFLTGNGLYDAQLGGQYGLVLYVKNNLVDPKAANITAVTQSKSWMVQAARVRVNPKDYVGAYQPSPMLAAVTGDTVLPVGDSNTLDPAGGSGVIQVNPLADGIQTALQSFATSGQVVLGITLQGRTLDGARLDTNEWYFPLDVCVGCLSTPPTCTSGQTLGVTTCPTGQLGVPACM